MRRFPRRRLALPVALLAILAGGTAVALGATSGGAPRGLHRGRPASGPVAVAAGYLGISRRSLRGELASGRTLAQIAAATPGHSEAGLVAALEAAARTRLRAAGEKLPARVQKLVHANLRRAASSGPRASLRAAALSYLGLSRKRLASELRKGRSLAQIADATPGRSATGLSEALLAAVAQRLQTRVANGTISRSAEERRLAAARQRISAVLDRSRAARSARPTR